MRPVDVETSRAVEQGGSLCRDPVRLSDEVFSVDDELRRLKSISSSMGGVATFIGYARDHSEGQSPLVALEFDAYEPMALDQLAHIRHQALNQFDIMEARIVHRLGRIACGDPIVLVAVGARHRAPALEACSWLIDELKQCVPIWKKEIGIHGGEWVVPHP